MKVHSEATLSSGRRQGRAADIVGAGVIELCLLVGCLSPMLWLRTATRLGVPISHTQPPAYTLRADSVSAAPGRDAKSGRLAHGQVRVEAPRPEVRKKGPAPALVAGVR